jgi:S-adenosylmethionine-diacylglycerol 3-amino-3-carboxypropyl transferase
VKTEKPQNWVGNCKRVGQAIHRWCFTSLHRNRLLYNACWEDPRIDRNLLRITPESRLLVITSAGCNVLDYLLDDPAEIVAIDINPRQNALLELKLALIRRGIYEDLFATFGRGVHPDFCKVFRAIRDDLPPYARDFWQQRQDYFCSRRFRASFYYHGVAGEVAWLICSVLAGMNRRLRNHLRDLIEATSLSEQSSLYRQIEPFLFNGMSRGALRQPLILSMLGVHQSQLALIENEYRGGVGQYLSDKLRRVFTQLPIRENYFWRVYITGSYTPQCCPNYLKPENFSVLRQRLDRVRVITASLTDFLQREEQPFTHFALLDHQDWLACHDPLGLAEEWKVLLSTSLRGSKLLLRSASLALDYLPAWLGGRLRFAPERTGPIHLLDRVGTYGSLHLAEVQ